MQPIIAVAMEVIFSTYKIRSPDGDGTGFFFEYNGRDFLVTAKHCVNSLQSGDALGVHISWTWQYTRILELAFDEQGLDMAVAKLEMECPARLKLSRAGFAGTGVGQEVLIAGYPLGYEPRLISGDEYRLQPLIKKGITAGMLPSGPLLDLYVNRGFSGGPVLVNTAENALRPPVLKCVGVVSEYKFDRPIPVYRKREDGIFVEADGYVVKGNSGFTEIVNIDSALRLMDAMIC